MTNDIVNQVTISGKLQKPPKVDAEKFFCLVNVGLEKWIPVTAHVKDERGEKDLLTNLAKFEEGDTITFKGYVRPWSQKKGDEWHNGLDIRITHLKPGTVPARQPKTAQQANLPEGW